MKKVYLIAVVFALIAGFATFYFASEINKKTTIKDADTVTILVPVVDIGANTSITEDMFVEDASSFVEKTVLADSIVAENTAVTAEDLVGQVTVDPLYAGEPINKNRLESIDGADVALSLKLPKNKVAYSFSAASVTSVDGYISEGDTVDVIVYERSSDSNGNANGKSSVKYKDLKILRVSTNSAYQSASAKGSAITEYSTLTVEVTEKQALKLYQIENENSFKLVLNHRD